MKKIIIAMLFASLCQFIFCQHSGIEHNNVPNNQNTTDPDDPGNPPNPNNPGNTNNYINLTTSVNRTSGVAPLAVHFFSDFVRSADDSIIAPATRSEKSHRFHHYDYTWNFGETMDECFGTTGKSKNTAKGAVAAHVFEKPGTYSVTLTIRDLSTVISTENYSITVTDPNQFYDNTFTTCVNNSGDDNFDEAPAGARRIKTNDLSTIVKYATSGSRILFKRGSSWTTDGLNWPGNEGPVTIGAYGTGTNPDALGIFDNAPRIIVTGGSFICLDHKQDWRFMDLHLIDSTRSYGCFNGASNIQRILFQRLKIQGFFSGISIDNWNEAVYMPRQDIFIQSCDISDCQRAPIYTGSHRLAISGNILRDSQISHIVRIWLSNCGVISNNIISGAAMASEAGMHALKFHGPGEHPGATDTYSTNPIANTNQVDVKTEYSIISDNVFGSSAPWPVALGPQNNIYNESISNIIFERNRLCSDYGNRYSNLVQVALYIWGTYITVRNNIIDGTGSYLGYTAIDIDRSGIETAPTGVEVFNNTIFRGDSGTETHRGIRIGQSVTKAIVKNNLFCFPYVTGPFNMIEDRSTSADSVYENNIVVSDPAEFRNPASTALPLNRDFRLKEGSIYINPRIDVIVFDDFMLNSRSGSLVNPGAYKQ